MKKLILICIGLMVPLLTTAEAPGFVFFECWPSALGSGPPYPTEPLSKNIYMESDSGGLQQTSIISAGIEGVGPELPLTMTSHNGDGGLYAIDSFFDVYYDGGSGDFPAESFFDVFVEIDLPDGTGTLLRKEPTLYFVDSFFDVFVELDIEGSEGDYLVLQMHVESAEPTSLTFNGRGIDLNEDEKVDTLESFFDVWFELDVPDPSVIDPGQRLVSIGLTGKIAPEPGSLTLVAMGLLGIVAILIRKR